jgi:hypothetical protein
VRCGKCVFASRKVLWLVLESYGTLEAVSAALVMPLHDSDISINVPFTFYNYPVALLRGLLSGVCIGPGPVLASRALFPPAAAAAARRRRGLVSIAERSSGGVGPDRGLRGGGRRGLCEEWARTG